MAGEVLETGEEVVEVVGEHPVEVAALKNGDAGPVEAWYQREFPAADKTLEGRITLEREKADIQAQAGQIGEAITTLNAARSLAFSAGAGQEALEIDEDITKLKAGPSEQPRAFPEAPEPTAEERAAADRDATRRHAGEKAAEAMGARAAGDLKKAVDLILEAQKQAGNKDPETEQMLARMLKEFDPDGSVARSIEEKTQS